MPVKYIILRLELQGRKIWQIRTILSRQDGFKKRKCEKRNLRRKEKWQW